MGSYVFVMMKLTVAYLALLQRLVKALAQGDVGIVAGTVQELLDLPSTGSGRVVVVLRGRLLGWGCRGHLAAAASTGEHAGNGMPHGMTNGDTTSGGSHLA